MCDVKKNTEKHSKSFCLKFTIDFQLHLSVAYMLKKGKKGLKLLNCWLKKITTRSGILTKKEKKVLGLIWTCARAPNIVYSDTNKMPHGLNNV